MATIRFTVSRTWLSGRAIGSGGVGVLGVEDILAAFIETATQSIN
jgi:hypothetical protein